MVWGRIEVLNDSECDVSTNNVKSESYCVFFSFDDSLGRGEITDVCLINGTDLDRRQLDVLIYCQNCDLVKICQAKTE